MNEPINTTTRRFPRSLADAFPDERSRFVTVGRRGLIHRLALLLRRIFRR